MKRMLICTSLMAAVALSATALAGTHGYHGYKGQVNAHEGGGKIRFSANLQRHRVRKVRISNVTLVCDQGAVKFSHRMHPRAKRLRRAHGALTFRFQDKIKHGGSQLRVFVSGDLDKYTQYRAAFGLIYASGDLYANQTGCSVNPGLLHVGARWRAHRR
jgi:hypothetical protein